MSNFIGRPPLLKFAMGWHRNHVISHSPNPNFFEDTFVSNPGGPNEQFGTHEKLPWGGARLPKLDAGVYVLLFLLPHIFLIDLLR